MRFLPSTLGLLGGAALGVVVSVSLPAKATRNSVGTYSLPSGNPVVSGTTISSTWANNTLGDMAVEITNSLDRQGRGAMLAPLQLSLGTSTNPSLTFTGDPDTGLYRAGSNDVRMQVDGAESIRFTSAGTSTPGLATIEELSVSSESTFSGISTFNGAADFTVPAAFSSGGPALTLRPGSADHTYMEYYADTGAPSTRSGFTGYSSAGASDFSITNTMTGGNILLNTPGQIVAGSTIMLGSGNAAASVAATNTVTPKSVIKAWARLAPAGSGSTSVTVVDGFNVTGATVSGSSMTVTLASAMTNSSNYAVLVTPGSSIISCSGLPSTTTTLLVSCRNIGGAALPFPFHDFQAAAAAQSVVYIAVLGAQ